MDSLGGLLIKGLLGNPILAHFNLFLDITIEDITPTPTPTGDVTPTPSNSYTVTPTPTPAVSSTLPTITIPVPIGGGGGRGPEEKKTVRIVIRYKTKEWSSIHTITDKMLRVTINTISALNVVKQKLINITLKLKKKEPTTVQVKRHDD